MIRIVRLLLLHIILSAAVGHAGALTPEQVPEPLKPWIGWVLQDHTDLGCPFLFNNYQDKQCSWPTRTHLELKPETGTFSAGWAIYRESWVPLPGDGEHWPLNVTVNNKIALVIDKDGRPSVKLAEGHYQIKGEFVWDAIPDSLSIPSATGLLELSINGVTITTPAIRDGQLWLKESETGQKKPENIQNNLDLQVFRKIIDEVPLQVLTHLELDVSGEQREVKLALPILSGFLPLQLRSVLPARIEPDGQLLIQLRPGRWQIEIASRAINELKTIPFPVIEPNRTTASTDSTWPESEIWVFDAHPQLRLVEIEGPDAIDPSQTNLPDDWKSLPAYKINQGQAMDFKVIRRGDPQPEPNQLNLTRKLWLDFDGQGYTVNDTITGTMTSGWSLNALPDTRLGKVMLGGQPQLITEQAGTGKQGVEVRKGVITLDADSRNTGSISKLNAAGWEHSFHNVSAELNLPPGWRLLAAAGVDNVPDSWISRWTLLDLFLVLIAALATGKLWNRYWGLFALVTLALIWHEQGSPHFVWLNILAATALVRVLPQGNFLKFMRGYRNVFWLALIIITVPFIIAQVRMGLYPQLERPWQTINMNGYAVSQTPPPPTSAEIAVADAPAVLTEQTMAIPLSNELKREYKADIAGSAMPYLDSNRNDFGRIDPKAKVQTGPGLPQWQWNKVFLSWNGSVDAGQQVHLWYLSPVMTMLLNFLRVVLVTVLALLMFGVAEKFRFNMKGTHSLLLGVILLPLLSLPSQDVHADFPNQAMLDTLRDKLLEAPDCLPHCAQIPQMKLAIADKTLLLTLQIHAQQTVAVPLPTDYEQWFPNQVMVDGKAAQGLIRNGNSLWIGLAAGEHTVALHGATPLLNKFTLPLPLKPNRITVENSGWLVSGIRENGLADSVLQFSRVQNAGGASKTALAPGILPSFVRLERTLQLGLDWHVHNRIVRVSPADSAIVLAIPLLTGESVSTEGIHVKNGKVEINLPASQTVLEWSSTLEKSDHIDLLATPSEHWTEVWRADISPIWHMESEGIAMIHLNSASQWLPEWHPWPGEKVTLHITRPQAVAGQTLTIDNSTLTIRPGQRTREGELKLNLRSSQGAQHTLILPDQALLQSVTIDGQTQPLRQEGDKLTLPVKPGKQQVQIKWLQAATIAGIITTPKLDLGAASVNSNLAILLGPDRWVLFTMGPRFGPAVLFWGVLIVIVILSIGLGKVQLTPLKTRHWLLLLVGLSQIPVESAGGVIAWFMLLGWRADKTSKLRYFNAVQVGIGLLTLMALSLLFSAVAQGLLGSPDMQIIGNQSSAQSLRWYQDRTGALLPTASVVSLPLMAYRLLMLAWSLWLAVSLLNWLKWGWRCFSSDGLWHKKVIQKRE